VPSRSKITSLMECGSKARWVRIMPFQHKALGRQPSAFRGQHSAKILNTKDTKLHEGNL
jgi:hypothetical protein